MTHKDIYTKYLIEYDKANVTSSYPLLTEYEVAVILNKSYNALIAQKLTGNNIRRAPFEADIKAIQDVQPLITHRDCILYKGNDIHAFNIVKFDLPKDCMYYVQSQLNCVSQSTMDNQLNRLVPIKLVSHDVALKFFITPYNMPWIKNPVCYIEGDTVNVVYDSIDSPTTEGTVHLTYIRKPHYFATTYVMDKDLTEPDVYEPEDADFAPDLGIDVNYNEVYHDTESTEKVTYSSVYNDYDGNTTTYIDFSDTTKFELSDTMADELIDLAIVFSLETVEAQRTVSKLNMRGLEA